MIEYFLNRIVKAKESFLKDQKGGILIQMAFSIFVIIAMLGIGIDVSRAYLYRAKLSGALDAAALAGAKSFHSASRDDEIQAFFESKFDDNFMVGTVGSLVITEVDTTTKTLAVSVSGELDTTFMKLFGVNTLDIDSAAETTSKQTGLQLVMVLDNTGSMRSSDSGTVRIDALKSASTTLVVSLFGDDAANDVYVVE